MFILEQPSLLLLFVTLISFVLVKCEKLRRHDGVDGDLTDYPVVGCRVRCKLLTSMNIILPKYAEIDVFLQKKAGDFSFL